jgi:hypothetical protein
MHRAEVGRAAVRRRLNGAILLSHVRQVCSVLNTCVTKAGSAKNIQIKAGPVTTAPASRKLQAQTGTVAGTHAKSDADARKERLAKSVEGKS